LPHTARGGQALSRLQCNERRYLHPFCSKGGRKRGRGGPLFFSEKKCLREASPAARAFSILEKEKRGKAFGSHKAAGRSNGRPHAGDARGKRGGDIVLQKKGRLTALPSQIPREEREKEGRASILFTSSSMIRNPGRETERESRTWRQAQERREGGVYMAKDTKRRKEKKGGEPACVLLCSPLPDPKRGGWKGGDKKGRHPAERVRGRGRDQPFTSSAVREKKERRECSRSILPFAEQRGSTTTKKNDRFGRCL